MKNDKIKRLVIIALMAALVLVFSLIQIQVAEGARVHLGNGMCLLAGLMFSPIASGLAAGIGSLFFDLLFYPTSIPFEFLITFTTKFIMAFICSFTFRTLAGVNKKAPEDKIKGSLIDDYEVLSKLKSITEHSFIIFASILGEIVYIILYMGKSFVDNYIVLGQSFEATKVLMLIKLGSSTLNALFAVVMASIFYQIVKKIRI